MIATTRRRLSLSKARPPAASYPEVQVADRHLPELTAAVRRLLTSMGRRLSATRLSDLAELAEPAAVAAWAWTDIPAPVAKAAPAIDVADTITRIVSDAATITGRYPGDPNEQAASWARYQAGKLITGINEETRQLIAQLVAANPAGNVDRLARAVRPLIGLTPAQATAALNYRAALERAAAENRRGKDAAAAMQGRYALSPWRGGPLPDDRIDRLVEQYTTRQRNWRAELIARTESMRAANHGQDMAWNWAARQGEANGLVWVKTWVVTHDDRLCPFCAPYDGRRLVSSAIDPHLDWLFPEDQESFAPGVPLPPLHPACRCVVSHTLEPAGAGAAERTLGELGVPEWYPGYLDDRDEVLGLLGRARGNRILARTPDPAHSDARVLVGRGHPIPGPLMLEAEEKVRQVGAKVRRQIEDQMHRDGFTPSWKLDERYAQTRRTKGREAAVVRSFLDGEADRANARAYQGRFVNRTLSQLREMGGDLHLAGSMAEVPTSGKLGLVASHFPSSWIDASNNHPSHLKLEPDGTGRAHYTDGDSTIRALHWVLQEEGDSTLAHELAHRFEHINPDVGGLELALWSRRTARPRDGESLFDALVNRHVEPTKSLRDLTGKPYAPDEVTRPDRFPNPYMGKTYGEAWAWELLSTGTEGIYYGNVELDTDLVDFLLGLLAVGP